MKVALAQIDCRLGDIAFNCSTMAHSAQVAADTGCDLVVFPEMSDLGYQMNTIKEKASYWPTGSFSLVQKAASQYHIAIIAGLAERIESGVYNTLAAFSDQGQMIAKYRKIHLFSGSPVFEHKHLLAGDEVVTFIYRDVTIGLMTCYDLRFPELARELALRGAEMIALSAAWPQIRIHHWNLLTQARAIENQLYVCAVNRTGIDAGIHFGGCSQIVDPMGEAVMLAEGQLHTCAKIDKSLVTRTRQLMSVLEDCRLRISCPRWDSNPRLIN